MTVLYASRELKQAQPTRELDEQQLYDYILDWKKSWNSDEKKRALASTIRNLVLLGWMRVRISESL
ncbi:MAG: Appr-1-p processing protein, partial [Metallibacterium sp.]